MDHFFHGIQGWFDYSNLYNEVVTVYSGKKDLKFLELGSWRGRSAAYLAVELANRTENPVLYCVDTWTGTGSLEVISPPPVPGLDMRKLYEEFTMNTAPVSNIISPIRLPSNIAALQFEDRSLDFVFIDAGHTYEDVKKDIITWLPKLRENAIMAGHDYLDANFPGVRQAVDELLPDAEEYLPFSWFLKPGFTKKYQEKFCPWLK